MIAQVEVAGSSEMLTSPILHWAGSTLAFNITLPRCLATSAHKFVVSPDYLPVALQVLQTAWLLSQVLLPYLVSKPEFVHKSTLNAMGASFILSCSAIGPLSTQWMYTMTQTCTLAWSSCSGAEDSVAEWLLQTSGQRFNYNTKMNHQLECFHVNR